MVNFFKLIQKFFLLIIIILAASSSHNSVNAVECVCCQAECICCHGMFYYSYHGLVYIILFIIFIKGKTTCKAERGKC